LVVNTVTILTIEKNMKNALFFIVFFILSFGSFASNAEKDADNLLRILSKTNNSESTESARKKICGQGDLFALPPVITLRSFLGKNCSDHIFGTFATFFCGKYEGFVPPRNKPDEGSECYKNWLKNSRGTQFGPSFRSLSKETQQKLCKNRHFNNFSYVLATSKNRKPYCPEPLK